MPVSLKVNISLQDWRAKLKEIQTYGDFLEVDLKIPVQETVI